MGLLRQNKNIIIPTIYDECYTFLDDLAVVGVLNEKKKCITAILIEMVNLLQS